MVGFYITINVIFLLLNVFNVFPARPYLQHYLLLFCYITIVLLCLYLYICMSKCLFECVSYSIDMI